MTQVSPNHRKYIDYLVSRQIKSLKINGLEKTYVRSNRALATFDKIKEGVSRELVAIISTVENFILKNIQQIFTKNSEYNRHYWELLSKKNMKVATTLSYENQELKFFKVAAPLNQIIDELYCQIGGHKIDGSRRKKRVKEELKIVSSEKFSWNLAGNKENHEPFRLIDYSDIGIYKGEATILLELFPPLLIDVGIAQGRYLLDDPIKGNHYTLLENFSEALGYPKWTLPVRQNSVLSLINLRPAPP